MVLGVHYGCLCWGQLRQHIKECSHCIGVVVDDGHMKCTGGEGGGMEGRGGEGEERGRGEEGRGGERRGEEGTGTVNTHHV